MKILTFTEYWHKITPNFILSSSLSLYLLFFFFKAKVHSNASLPTMCLDKTLSTLTDILANLIVSKKMVNFGQLTDGYVLISSACLQTRWLFTASASSHGWMGSACRSCAPPCCSSWMLAPAGRTIRRSWVVTPPPGPQELKVTTDLLLMISIKC